MIVGDGDATDTVRAKATNAALGRRAAQLTGALHDPRSAYIASDPVIGMSGSALRALAFGKPLVVGETPSPGSSGRDSRSTTGPTDSKKVRAAAVANLRRFWQR